MQLFVFTDPYLTKHGKRSVLKLTMILSLSPWPIMVVKSWLRLLVVSLRRHMSLGWPVLGVRTLPYGAALVVAALLCGAVPWSGTMILVFLVSNG